MVYHYNGKRHVVFLAIRLFIMFMILLSISIALSALVLCVTGYPFSFMFNNNLDPHSKIAICFFVFLLPRFVCML